MISPLTVLAVQRDPSDPYFYASVTINGAVIGSRYLLLDNDDHSTVLSEGLISSYLEVIPNVPSYDSPMVMFLRLRNATGVIKYKTYEGYVPHSSTGATFYVSQVKDL